jgi:hypothetical protein
MEKTFADPNWVQYEQLDLVENLHIDNGTALARMIFDGK